VRFQPGCGNSKMAFSGDYGTDHVPHAAVAYLQPNDTTASDSDAQEKSRAPKGRRPYKLWSHEISEEGPTSRDAIESLGECYNSGRISRFEFISRTSLIESYSIAQAIPEDSGLSFIVEEGEDGNPTCDTFGGNSLCAQLSRRCCYGASRATTLLCVTIFTVCSYCVPSKVSRESYAHEPLT
jgi:hypothetical protein